MQGFGLPRHVVRNGCVASRLRAQSPGTEAPRRDGPVRCLRQAIADGLTGRTAAQAMDVARAGLYRREQRLEPRSRRPNRFQKGFQCSNLKGDAGREMV